MALGRVSMPLLTISAIIRAATNWIVHVLYGMVRDTSNGRISTDRPAKGSVENVVVGLVDKDVNECFLRGVLWHLLSGEFWRMRILVQRRSRHEIFEK